MLQILAGYRSMLTKGHTPFFTRSWESSAILVILTCTANVMIDDKICASFCICPHSVATSCDFMFWLHLRVMLTDTSLPLEATVSTMSVTLSKWKREIWTGGSRGTKELKFFFLSCLVSIQLQRRFSWQSNSVSIQSDCFPRWILQGFYPKNEV